MKWFQRNWLYILAIALPFERIPSYDVMLGGRSITIRASFLLALVIVSGAIALSMHRRKWPKFTTPDMWLGVYALVMVASAGLATSRGRSLTVILATTLVMAVAIVIEHSLRRFSLDNLYRYLITVTLVVCVFGLYQFLGDSFGLPTAWTGLKEIYTRHVFGFPRIQSTGLEPLYFASFLLLPMMLLIGRIYTKSAKPKIYVLLGFIATIFALTLSRGGIYGAIGGCAVLVFLLRPNGSMKRLTMIVLTVGMATGCALGLIAITTKTNHSNDPAEKQAVSNYVKQSTHLSSGEGSADDDRSVNRRIAIQAFKEHPVLGVGIGNFGFYAQTHDPRYALNNKTVVNMEYLEVLAETGVVGMLVLLGFCATLLWGFVRTWKRFIGEEILWATAVFCALLAAGIQYYAFSTLYIIQLWFAFGLLMGLIRLRSSKAI